MTAQQTRTTRKLPWQKAAPKGKPTAPKGKPTAPKGKCAFILSRGINKGKNCSYNGNHNGFCSRHKKQIEVLPPYPEDIENPEYDESLLDIPPPGTIIVDNNVIQTDEFGTEMLYVIDEVLYTNRRDEYYSRKCIEFYENGNHELADKYYNAINFNKLQKSIAEQLRNMYL